MFTDGEKANDQTKLNAQRSRQCDECHALEPISTSGLTKCSLRLVLCIHSILGKLNRKHF